MPGFDIGGLVLGAFSALVFIGLPLMLVWWFVRGASGASEVLDQVKSLRAEVRRIDRRSARIEAELQGIARNTQGERPPE